MSGAISSCYTRLPVGSAILVPPMACLTRAAFSVPVLSVLSAAHSLSYTWAQPVSILRLYLLLVVLVSRKPGWCDRGVVTGVLG